MSLDAGLDEFISRTSIVAMLIASVLVLYGTKAKHPGWIGLLGVAILIGFAS